MRRVARRQENWIRRSARADQRNYFRRAGERNIGRSSCELKIKKKTVAREV